MKYGAIAIMSLLVLSGCDQSTKYEELKREEREFVVVSKKSPKHFKLTLRDVTDNKVYRFSRKRCSGHSKFKVGETIKMPLVTMKHTGDGSTYQKVRGICN